MAHSVRPLLAALALAAVTALPAAAQPPAQRGDRAAVTLDSRLHDLDEALDLTDAQEAQIRRILETQARARMEQMRSAERPSREAMRAQAEAANAEIRAVLTAEQATRYDALRAEQARTRGERGNGRGGNGPRGGGS